MQEGMTRMTNMRMTNSIIECRIDLRTMIDDLQFVTLRSRMGLGIKSAFTRAFEIHVIEFAYSSFAYSSFYARQMSRFLRSRISDLSVAQFVNYIYIAASFQIRLHNDQQRQPHHRRLQRQVWQPDLSPLGQEDRDLNGS